MNIIETIDRVVQSAEGKPERHEYKYVIAWYVIQFIGRALIILSIVMAFSCSDDEIYRPDKKPTYSFSIFAADHTSFQASIYWGVDELEFIEHVAGSGFGSSVELVKGETLHVQATADLDLTLIRNDTGARRPYHLEANKVLVINPYE